MNQKVKQLIQKLGEAIHESVSESENIAGVVRNIREQGFDVLLMLEATIGLNELLVPLMIDPYPEDFRGIHGITQVVLDHFIEEFWKRTHAEVLFRVDYIGDRLPQLAA